MNQTQRNYREDLPSEFKSVCHELQKPMLKNAVISEVHKICDVLHFLEACEMRVIFSNLANLYRIGWTTFCLSAMHLPNEVLAD